MERIKALDRFQKGLILTLIALAVIFGVIYGAVSAHKGYWYFDEILRFSAQNGVVTYSGTIDGRACCFTVTDNKTVTFQCGENTYGPYTAKEDPTAIPDGKDYLTGVQVMEGDSVFFRGGVYQEDADLLIYDEDGGFVFDIVVSSESGFSMDENGNIIDPLAPSAKTVLELMAGPKLESKGIWLVYILSVILSVLTVATIVFADELFRFELSFKVYDASKAEPSDLEIMRRYIGWTVLTVAALVFYILGLR